MRDVLLFSFDYPPNEGGISRLCGEIVKGLARRGPGVTVLTRLMAHGAGDPATPQVPELRVRGGRPRRELEALRVLRRTAAGTAVICGLWYPEALLAALVGVRPVVILAHGAELLSPRWRRPLWPGLMRGVLEWATLVVANGEYTRRLAASAAPNCRCVAVHLAVDHDRFTPGDREAARRRFGGCGRLVLSTVSRLQAYKGHDVVLEALASLEPAVRERFLYLVAGQGPAEPVLRARARQLGVEPLVRWLGYVPEEALPDLYRASDLFVLCTREAPERREVEGFGLVFVEAQACGTPVVGTRTGGIPDAVREGEGGWLIAQDDAQALASLFRELARNPMALEAAGAAARRRVERECTWDHYLDRLTAALAAAGIRFG